MVEAFMLTGVKVSFPQGDILQVDELSLAAGKIYAIIGPSGAGKSTLLRVLNLLQKPTEGQVGFFGKPLVYEGSKGLIQQRQMVMVFQKPAIFNGTVFYNVALGLKLRGLKKKEIAGRVEEALDTVGLQELSQRSAANLSGGEAQRVALARAMVVRPKVLLLDEPTSNLDPANVAIFEELVRKIHRDLGTTIVMVTHNLHQAKRVAQETIFLHRGRVVEIGPTGTIFDQPRCQETRAFLAGEMVY
ncbi:MAG: ABC transporter ATP-binding protein [Thermincolia bacterium]